VAIGLNKQVSEDLAIKDAALALLSRREHSRHELMSKLSRKFTDIDKIEQQLQGLADSNLQSEERFIESFIRAKINRGKGPKFIKQELRRRGISEYLIAAYVYERDDNWFHIASEVYKKKFGSKRVSDGKEKARRIRFMVSRGFTPETVFRLLDS